MHKLMLGLALGIVGTVVGLRMIHPAKAIVGTLDISGTSQTLTGDVTAARLVDAANSSYFIDPAASGTSLSLAGAASISGNLTLPQGAAMRPAFGPTTLSYKSGMDAWTTGLTIQDGTGNVGIGTTSPGQKLSVAGTVESTTGGFKFPDGSTQTAAATGMTSGMIAFFASACPSGWTEYTALRGRYVVGTPLSGTTAGTSGTALTNLEDRTHTHTGPSHTHTQNMGGGQQDWSSLSQIAIASGGSGSTTYTQGLTAGYPSGLYAVLTGVQASGTGATGTAATSSIVPYIQLTACQKN